MASTSPVGKTTAIAPSELVLFHRNPRKGDVSAIASSLRRHGQYKPITVNIGTATGRPNEVLAGNHTLMAFRDLAEQEPDDKRWHKVLVHWINVDDDLAERIVVADNQTGQLGGFDEAELAELVKGFEGDIEGLGFTDADVDDLMAILEENETQLPDNDGTPFDGSGKNNGFSNDPANPGRRDDGLINAKDMTTRKDEYAESAASRMVVLTMPINVFVWVQGQLEKARAEYGVETNTEAVIKLLELWSAEEAPMPEVSQPETPDFTAADPEGFTDDDD